MKKHRWHKAINVALALVLVAVLAVALLPQPTHANPDPDWYDANWTYRRTITIDHTKVEDAAPYTDFPVLVYATGLSNIEADGADIRFTSSDAVTELPREIESYSGGTLYAWVKVTLTKDLGDGEDDVIYMYYGNTKATEPAIDSTYGAENVWDANYMGVWHETNAADLDSTANDNDLTVVATVTQASGKIDGGVEYGGTSGYQYAADSSSLDVTGSLTLEAWVYPIDGGAYGFITKGDRVIGNNDCNYEIRRIATGTVHFKVNVGGTIVALKEGAITLDTDTWYYVVGTYDGSNMIDYVNGDEDATQAQEGALTADTNNLALGAWVANSLFSNSRLDEARISNTARSADWIKTCYTNQNAPVDFITLGSETRNWESYSDSGHTTVENSFADDTNHVYMFGEGFASGTTKVGWYDGNNDLKQTDTYTDWVGGNLDFSECELLSFGGPPPTAAAGTWHAVVLLQADALPAAYADALTDPDYIVDDSFEVAASAIPEFPEVIAAIGVSGLCFGIYWWMRKRAKFKMQSAKEI